MLNYQIDLTCIFVQDITSILRFGPTAKRFGGPHFGFAVSLAIGSFSHLFNAFCNKVQGCSEDLAPNVSLAVFL